MRTVNVRQNNVHVLYVAYVIEKITYVVVPYVQSQLGVHCSFMKLL